MRHDVRPDRTGLRRHEPRHDGRARPEVATAHGRGGRPAGRHASSTPAAGRATSRSPRSGRAASSRASTSRARCSSGRGASRTRSSGSRVTCWRCRSPDASFDAATVGFGVRNVADLEAASRELRRVLRPGGRLAILEITQPRGPLKPFFSLWFDRIVPLLGRVLPGGKAYTYLPASVRRFPGAEELAALVATTGFEDAASASSAARSSPCTRRRRDERHPRDRPGGARARRLPRRGRGAARALRRGPPRPRRRGRSRRAHGGREAAAADADVPLGAGRRAPLGRRGRGGRARPHGDARPRRPDRPRQACVAAGPPPGRRTAPTPRAPRATTSSRARSPSSPRSATSTRSRSSPRRRWRSPAARRCSAASGTTRTRRWRATSSAAP